MRQISLYKIAWHPYSRWRHIRARAKSSEALSLTDEVYWRRVTTVVTALRDRGFAEGRGRSTREAAAVTAAGKGQREEILSRDLSDTDGMRIADAQTNRKGFRIPAALRECSVVIIGSTCRICGKDFKCESDVALHTRWRHNATVGPLMDILNQMNHGDEQKCDVCDMPFKIVSDLKIHKRLIHRQRPRNRGKRQKEMIRVKFKLNGVTTTDVSLDRKYIKVQNSFGYLVDVCTQTPDSLENKKRQDNCAGNIDSSFPNHVVDKSHVQYGIRPYKVANRYIVGKFASTKGDTIARPTVVGRSLAEISHRDTIPDNDGSCEEGYGDSCYLAFQKNTGDTFIKSFADSINIHDKENSQRINKRERRNVYCQSEISFDDDDDIKVFLVCQTDKSDGTFSPMSKQNSWSSKSPHHPIRWPSEVAGTKETTGLANSLIDSVEIIIDNEKNYNSDGDATKHLLSPLSRLNVKNESTKASSNVDDDVQEVLRITRGDAQNDINHESPNRMEREMLVQNAISETFTLPSRLEPTICPEKCGAAFTKNFEPSNYPTFMTATESDYQFLTNSFDKKLGICLGDLHRYGIRYYNDLPEINNNLEEYAVYAHQNFFETWKQSAGTQYTTGLKTNDNEVAVVLD